MENKKFEKTFLYIIITNMITYCMQLILNFWVELKTHILPWSDFFPVLYCCSLYLWLLLIPGFSSATCLDKRGFSPLSRTLPTPLDASLLLILLEKGAWENLGWYLCQ